MSPRVEALRQLGGVLMGSRWVAGYGNALLPLGSWELEEGLRSGRCRDGLFQSSLLRLKPTLGLPLGL